MNLRHLEFFVVLAEELNFTRAAQRLYVAQPALSQQIRTLEQRIGAVLVDRSARPMRLTPAGSYFLSEAHQILSQFDSARLSAREIGQGKRGWLGVGFTRSAMYSVLPPALKAFSSMNTDIELKLFELFTEQQADALQEGRIHIGIGRQAQDVPGCIREVLLEEQLMVALPNEHPLAQRKRKSIPLTGLAGEPFILYPKHPQAAFVRFVTGLCQGAGFLPQVAYHAQEMQSAIALVAAGLGITLVAESVARHGRTDVVFRRLEGDEISTVTTLTAAYRASDSSEALRRFLDLLTAGS